MHDEIERFTRDGLIIKDNVEFVRIKEYHIRDLKTQMRLSGVMPIMDMDPHWSTEYNAEKDEYTCALTLYGVYVGEDDCSEEYELFRGRRVKIK